MTCVAVTAQEADSGGIQNFGSGGLAEVGADVEGWSSCHCKAAQLPCCPPMA